MVFIHSTHTHSHAGFSRTSQQKHLQQDFYVVLSVGIRFGKSISVGNLLSFSSKSESRWPGSSDPFEVLLQGPIQLYTLLKKEHFGNNVFNIPLETLALANLLELRSQRLVPR